MNMKKTMAAIAAGAVAVSAMATSVSALADKTLKYNLVETVVVKGDGEVTLTARFTNLDLSGAGATETITLAKGVNSQLGDVKSVSITGRNTSDNTALTPINLSTDNQSDNYSTKLTTAGNITLDVGSGLDLPASSDITLVVTYVVKHHAGGISDVNASTSSVTVTGITQDAVASNFQGQGETKHEFPLATSLTANTNIINYLETKAVNPNTTRTAGSYSTHGETYTATDATYGSYYNVGAVLNDAVANYEGVVFKFNTATKRVANTGVDSWYGVVGEYIRDDWYDKSKSDDYTQFAEHLYNGTNALPFGLTSYGSEQTGYTGYDWAGYNLFQGALVVNESLTMSLSDTEFFDWQGTSISFDWDSIYSNAMTSNNFATYIQSLKLATSSLWYWDSMEVELTAGAAEDASSGAGVTGDDDTLDDTDDDDDGDIALDDDDDDSDIGVDDDDDDADDNADDTQAPAQTASNPQTGNASVALAVIPVALAAAAIVAKKRG